MEIPEFEMIRKTMKRIRTAKKIKEIDTKEKEERASEITLLLWNVKQHNIPDPKATDLLHTFAQTNRCNL